MQNGKFVISLDFELMWGVRDKKDKTTYGENIKGVHSVIPRMLTLFRKYDTKATFSTVGFLFCKNRDELIENTPAITPYYTNTKLNPYLQYFEKIGENETDDPWHYCHSLIELIKSYPEQEIGTHTYSHYYCLEQGQTTESFDQDIKAAIKIGKAGGINIKSLVFPRNQFNDKYLQICADAGITCYRGNEHSWLYEAKNAEGESRIRRGFRLMDSFINLSGHNTYSREYMKSSFPVNIPASRFLRPYSKKLKSLDKLKLSRIKAAMTHAAKTGEMFHLWWHPHNFGVNQDRNFDMLEKILQHYQELNKTYNFESVTMSALAKELTHGK